MSPRDLTYPTTEPASDTYGRRAAPDNRPRLPAAVKVVPQRGGGRHRSDTTPASIVEAIVRFQDGRYTR